MKMEEATLLQKTCGAIKEKKILTVIVLLFIIYIIYIAVMYQKGNTEQLQFAIDWIMTVAPKI